MYRSIVFLRPLGPTWAVPAAHAAAPAGRGIGGHHHGTGHAVIVVDMAENPATGEKLYLLAQSYMPAQDIQVLVNLKERDKSPWYTLKGEGSILTPEWGFTSADLKRFKD